jgi:hypothetical protein
VIARTLGRRIVITTTEREAFDAIRFLDCEPEIPCAPPIECVQMIEPRPAGGYCIRGTPPDVEEVPDLKSLIDRLHSRLFTYSLADRPQAGVLHAASLRQRGRRVLIAGAEGSGKTTLALHLVRSGYDLEGDEHVFLEPDGVIARPRACRVKEASLALLPLAADVISGAPCYVDELGRRTFNVDPRMIGGSWRIEKGEVACVIVLQPKHNGSSSLTSASPLALAQALVSEMGLREAGRGASIREVAALVSGAPGFQLSLGDHRSAVECVNRALD